MYVQRTYGMKEIFIQTENAVSINKSGMQKF